MDRLPIPVFLSFPGGSDGKEPTCDAGDLDSIPGLRRSPGREHDNTRACNTLVFLPGESPWTEKPGRLQSLGLQRVGHDWVTKYNTEVYFIVNYKNLAYNFNFLSTSHFVVCSFHSNIPCVCECTHTYATCHYHHPCKWFEKIGKKKKTIKWIL